MTSQLNEYDKLCIDYYNRQALIGKMYHPLVVDGSSPGVFSELVPGHTVVDAGCGYGRAVSILPALGINGYLGLDFADEQIALAQRLFPGFRFDVCSIYDMGKKYPLQFDGFILTAVLMCIPRTRAHEALMSIRATLKPGALGLVATLHGQGISLNSEGFPAYRYQFEELKAEFLHAGFISRDLLVQDGMLLGTVRMS